MSRFPALRFAPCRATYNRASGTRDRNSAGGCPGSRHCASLRAGLRTIAPPALGTETQRTGGPVPGSASLRAGLNTIAPPALAAAFPCTGEGACATRPLVDGGKALAALDPFRAGEDARSELDQARQHVEDGDRSPLAAFARPKAFVIELLGHFGERNVLDDEFHHGEQEFHLRGIFREALRVGRHLETERRFFQAEFRPTGGRRGWSAFRRAGRFALPFHFPLDGDELPALRLASAEILGIDRALYCFADVFEIRHFSLLIPRKCVFEGRVPPRRAG